MNIAANNPRPFREKILILLVVIVSGNPAFSSPKVAPFIMAAVLLLTVSKGTVPVDFLRRFWLIGAGFVMIGIVHAVQLKEISILATSYFLFKMFVGGLVLASMGSRFPERLFSVVFWMSVFGLGLQLLLVIIGPDAMPGIENPDWFGSNIKTMFIHTILLNDQWWRNSSMMWEPGAFQGVINLSLALLPASAWVDPARRWRMACVIIALLSTFSTTGYLVFFAVCVFKLIQFRISPSIKLLLVVLAIGGIVIAFNELEFLGQKISHQLASRDVYGGFAPDRFGAFLFDMHYIEKHPLFGNGLSDATRFADHPQLTIADLGHGNGLSNFVATFGLVGAILYFGGLLTGRIAVTLRDRLIFVFVVTIIVFGEQFLGYPLFLGLLFASASTVGQIDTRRAGLRTH